MIKQVGTAKYAHKSNVNELIEKCFKTKAEKLMFLQFLNRVAQQGLNGLQYDIIKYDKGNVTLITSPDWDLANEPIVGMCYRWKLTEWMTDKWVQPHVIKNFKQIYHSKWMFVADDYRGFDIAEAKKRSEIWNNLPDIKDVKKNIGYKSFWIQYLAKYGIPL